MGPWPGVSVRELAERHQEVIVPGVNPLHPPNVNEVLRRKEALRQETSRRESGYDDESWSRPKRKRKLARKLAKFITGTGEKKHG
jgi:hypothetical protein